MGGTLTGLFLALILAGTFVWLLMGTGGFIALVIVIAALGLYSAKLKKEEREEKLSKLSEDEKAAFLNKEKAEMLDTIVPVAFILIVTAIIVLTVYICIII